ncbi:MAG: preprotein translocase subunit SecY, partial [Lachnospiraceae bacterium]|nr:preprotein translocase subunit SecY [Lachnospiraceae bacterium]
GVGNGISIVLVINIISRLPADLKNLFTQFVKGKPFATQALAIAIILAIIIVMVVLVIFLNGGTRKIPVQYAQKVQGRKMVGGQSSTMPLKVNTAGVIPIIFAQSLMQFPIIICSFVDYEGTGFWREILNGLDSSNWCNPKAPIYSIGLLVYIVLVIFFAYFYTSITFNPLMVADDMKKRGGFIPGIRPGKPTSDYLTKVLNYIIFIGAVGLTIIGVLPYIFNGLFKASVSFGGTSLIIIVSVVLETMKQIESQMLVRNYKGFLND